MLVLLHRVVISFIRHCIGRDIFNPLFFIDTDRFLVLKPKYVVIESGE